jgi:acetyl/propionyl-CoA carboxylase alpha subunit
MSIRSVGVYALGDAEAAFTELADELYCLEGCTAQESYLDMDKLLACARDCKADAVHPGYGFLSESAEFAARVQEAGLVWIGPEPKTILDFGDKRNVKVWLAKHAPEVPLIPGITAASPSLEQLRAAAGALGYPVILKATCGGGGKGLRVVHASDQLAGCVDSVRNEARSSFGDERFLLEKYFSSVQHIEVQIVGDSHGHVVALGTRNCRCVCTVCMV